MSFFSAVIQTEQVVVAVVPSGASLAEVEGLSELHGLFWVTVDDEITWNEGENAVVEGGLGVEGD